MSAGWRREAIPATPCPPYTPKALPGAAVAQSFKGFTRQVCAELQGSAGVMVLLHRAGCVIEGGMHSDGLLRLSGPKVFPQFPAKVCQAEGCCGGQSTRSSVALLFMCRGR